MNNIIKPERTVGQALREARSGKARQVQEQNCTNRHGADGTACAARRGRHGMRGADGTACTARRGRARGTDQRDAERPGKGTNQHRTDPYGTQGHGSPSATKTG